MKFQRSAPVRIAHISEIDIFVTDKAPPASVVEICREHGVRIEIAGQDEEDAPAETNLNGDLAQ
jgi:DeoR family glycerol-3-phosphate regulon repressor